MYAITDVSSFGFERRRSGRTGASTTQTDLVVLFRDGSTVAIDERFDNYERLANHLRDNGISQR